jgi:hypothetical protein
MRRWINVCGKLAVNPDNASGLPLEYGVPAVCLALKRWSFIHFAGAARAAKLHRDPL